MNKNLAAFVILVICPLLAAQEPLSAIASSPDQQTSSAVVSVDAAAQPGHIQSSQPGTLLDGTPVKLRISQTISSEEAKTGQEISFEVLEDVQVAGMTVIKKSDSAFGTITKASPKRMMGRAGKLDMAISYVRLADQEKALLRGSKDSKGRGSAVGMTVGIAATAVLFFPAAPLFLLMHGKDVTVPEGTEVTGYVQGDMQLDMARFGAGPGVVASVPAVVGPVASTRDTACNRLCPWAAEELVEVDLVTTPFCEWGGIFLPIFLVYRM